MAELFHRVDTSKLVRGAARIMIAPSSIDRPLELDDVVIMADGGEDAQWTISAAGTITAGSFTLTYGAESPITVDYNDNAAALITKLEGLASIGAGNVNVTGGDIATAPFVITLQGDLAGSAGETITVDDTLLTGSTGMTVTVDVLGGAQYDARPNWTDLGGTREGIQISVNNTEDGFDIDQIAGIIGAAPNEWEVMVSTRLAEQTLETFQIVWEGSDITDDTAPATGTEREVGFAGATNYTERRLAVLFQKSDEKIRGYLFHRTVRAPQEGVIDHRKGGEAISTQIQFRALADETISDPSKQHFIIRDQQ